MRFIVLVIIIVAALAYFNVNVRNYLNTKIVVPVKNYLEHVKQNYTPATSTPEVDTSHQG